MHQILINNCTSQITPALDEAVVNALRNKLSYEILGALYARKINPYAGVKYFFTIKGQQFPTGLVHLVRSVLDLYKVPYDQVDCRLQPVLGPQIPFHDSLRDYQEDIVKRALESQRGIIKSCTGSGKTRCIASLISKLNVPTIVFIHKTDVFYQIIDTLEKTLKVPIGRVGNGKCEIERITVATIQTVARSFDPTLKAEEKDNELLKEKGELIRQMITNAQCLISDETHHLSSDSFWTVYKNAENAFYRYGFSVSGNSYIPVQQNELIHYVKIEDFPKFFGFEVKHPSDIVDISQKGLKTLSFDVQTHLFDWHPVTYWHRYVNTKDLYSVTYNGKNKNDNVVVTGDHSLITFNGGKTIVETKPTQLSRYTRSVPLVNISKGHRKKVFINIEECLKNLFSEINVYVPKDVKINLKSINSLKEIDYRLRWAWKQKRMFPLKYKNILFPDLKEGYHIRAIVQNSTKLSRPVIELNKYIQWLVGFYIGDGYVNKENKTAVCFCLGKKDLAKFKFILDRSGLLHSLSIKKSGRNCWTISVASLELRCIIDYLHKNQYALTKQLHSLEFNFDCPRWFFAGLIQSDGHAKNSKTIFNGRSMQSKVRTYLTNSLLLSKDLKLFSMLNEWRSNIFIRKPGFGGIVNGKQIVSKNNSYQMSFNLRNVTSFNLLAIPHEHEEYVYDLSVPKIENFLANGFLVHNSASPWRDDHADIMIEGGTAKQIIDIPASLLIDRGFLSPVDIFLYDFEHDRQPKGIKYPALYNQEIMLKTSRNKLIVELALKAADAGKSVLIAVTKIEHGEILETLLQAHDKNALFVHGGSDTELRRKVLDGLSNHTQRIAICTTIFGEGVDAPGLDVLINAKAGASSVDAFQLVGRVLRKTDTKKKAFVIDVSDSGCRFFGQHASERLKIYSTERNYKLRFVKEIKEVNFDA